MKYLIISVLLLSSLAFSSCQTTKNTGTTTESFTGTWRVNISGDLDGVAVLYVRDDNTFTSDNFRLRNISNNTYTNYSISGIINISSIQNGSLNRGNVAVGDFNGSFFKFTGNGTYSISLDNFSGTWQASKD